MGMVLRKNSGLVILIVLTLSCQGMAGGLDSDMRQILQKAKVDAQSDLFCHQIERTRAGYCQTRLSKNQVALLVEEYKLREQPRKIDYGSITDFDVGFLMAEKLDGCSKLENFRIKDDGKVFATQQYRPVELNFGNSGFDYLFLYYDEITTDACLQMDYSYS